MSLTPLSPTWRPLLVLVSLSFWAERTDLSPRRASYERAPWRVDDRLRIHYLIGGALKSLIAFYACLLRESGMRCGTSTARDLGTVTRRVEHEGQAFFTLALPVFAQDFERSLDQGYVDPNLFAGFGRQGKIPKFLSGFLGQVFDSETGMLLDDPNVHAIQEVRQLTRIFSKILLPCSDERVKGAYTSYVEVEQELVQKEVELFASIGSRERIDRFKRTALLAFAGVFTRVDHEVYAHEAVPRHGPGTVADRTSNNARWQRRIWTERLESIMPAGEYLIPNWHHSLVAESIELLDPGSEPPTKVTDVPKTLKAPRIIAIEPTHMQYAQQALFRSFTQSIRGSYLASNFMGYESNLPNQELARIGSADGSLATLDLSEASDRVLNRLVQEMFHRHPWVRAALDASRSTTAAVPQHGLIPLRKFASMGSAVCFPIESFVFATIALEAVCRSRGMPLSKASIKSLLGQVRVYGDDIIVPVDSVPTVVESLEAFGLKVNAAKSFWTGRFRESCGAEFYAGHDVTIVKCRRMLPRSRRDHDRIVSTVAMRNLFWLRGYHSVVEYLDREIEKLRVPYPRVLPSSPAVARWDTHYDVHSLHDDYLSPLVKAMVIDSRIPEDILSEYGALLKWHCLRGAEPLRLDHLLRAGRPRVVRIKTRAVSPF